MNKKPHVSLDHFLNENKMECLSLHGSMPPKDRQATLERILRFL